MKKKKVQWKKKRAEENERAVKEEERPAERKRHELSSFFKVRSQYAFAIVLTYDSIVSCGMMD